MNVKSDHRSKISNLSNWKHEDWKKSGLQQDSNPWPPRIPVRCSTNWAMKPHIDHSSHSSTTAVQYELLHIYFTSLHYTGKYEHNKLTSLPTCGFIAQLVEHRTGIHGGHGFESHWSPDFFSGFIVFNCSNWKIYCDDHSSHSSSTAVQYELFHNYILHSLEIVNLPCNPPLLPTYSLTLLSHSNLNLSSLTNRTADHKDCGFTSSFLPFKIISHLRHSTPIFSIRPLQKEIPFPLP